MPRPRLYPSHTARQAAYRARQNEKDIQPLVTPVSCPSPTCPLQLSADAPSARSGALPVSSNAPARTLLQLHDERALRFAVGDLLLAAQRCGLLDKGHEHEAPDQSLYRLARELWKQAPKS